MSNGYRVELTAEEVKILIGILKYALDVCPVESASDEVAVTRDKVEDLVEKLEGLVK